MKKHRPLPTTEHSNPRSKNIDRLSTTGIVELINSEDMLVAKAVGKERKKIAEAVDMIVGHFRKGGRLFYVAQGQADGWVFSTPRNAPLLSASGRR